VAPDWCNTRPICGVAENAYNSLLGQGLGPALRGSHAIQHASALATCGAILPVDHRVFLAAARAFDHLNEVPHVLGLDHGESPLAPEENELKSLEGGPVMQANFITAS
jgi:hypothetical protein